MAKFSEPSPSKMARGPSIRCLDQRTEMVLRNGGRDLGMLLLNEIDHGKRHELVPVRYDELFEPPITELSARCEFHFRCHDLRATFGNRLHRRGFPIETIVHLMRHENPDVTFKRCIGVDQDRMRSAMDRLCPSRPIQ